MSKEENNKTIVGRWFTDFWGKTCNLGIVDELAAPDMLLQYSLHAPPLTLDVNHLRKYTDCDRRAGPRVSGAR